jgi:hypothetical protein
MLDMFYSSIVGWDSAVSIPTRCGLGGLSIKYVCEADFPHSTGPALGPTQTPVTWVPGNFSGDKAARACL